MTARLTSLRAVLIDMDGVLWVGNQPLPGVANFFAFLQSHGIAFLLVTNNATRRAQISVDRLQSLGVNLTPTQVLTSADATAKWINFAQPDVRRVFVVGEEALVDALTEAGLQCVDQEADAVVVGLDRGLTYERLKRATLEIRRGASFIATNADRTLPTEDGLIPGAGSLIAALVAATDVEPKVIGKPHRPMFELALSLLKTPPEQTAMLGDRLDTDIDGAAVCGLKTILVVTGVSTAEEAARNPIKPDFIFENLLGLLKAWEQEISRGEARLHNNY